MATGKHPESDARLAAVYKLLTHLDTMLEHAPIYSRNSWDVLEIVRNWLSEWPGGRPRNEGVSYGEMRYEIRRLLDKWGIQ